MDQNKQIRQVRRLICIHFRTNCFDFTNCHFLPKKHLIRHHLLKNKSYHTMATAHQLPVMCYMLHRKISKECLENDENTCLKCNLVNFENPKWIYRLWKCCWDPKPKIKFKNLRQIEGTICQYQIGLWFLQVGYQFLVLRFE